MKQRSYILLLFSILLSANGYAQKGIMRLSQQTLMHEVRETPSPLDGQHIAVNPPRFMWPDKYPHLGAVLDGVEEEDFKPEVTYRIRIARDPEFKSEVITAERKWAFFNPFKLFGKGKWYWQHFQRLIPVFCSMRTTGITSSNGIRTTRKHRRISQRPINV